MTLIQYIITSTVSLAILFAVYKLLYSKDRNFTHLRIFLLGSIVLSLLLPLHKVEMDIMTLPSFSNQSLVNEALQTDTNINSGHSERQTPTGPVVSEDEKAFSMPWMQILWMVYFGVAGFFFLRLVYQLITMLLLYRHSQKEMYEGYTLIYNTKYLQTFSFFKWIFIHKSNSNHSLEEIISHEKIHVQQWHTLDLFLIETLSAVMWINPVVWLIRREVQLVHEYLADEGALDTGIDKLQYQALLLNQVTEERLICLSSSFQSSIKKRMIMMTKRNVNQTSKVKILLLLPLSGIIFLSVACLNETTSADPITAIAPTKMNVLYLGVDNPVSIAASGYDADELDVQISNGSIRGEAGDYVINPAAPGNAIVTVLSKGKEIKKAEFRVKTVPNPQAGIITSKGIIPGGTISKEELLNSKEISVFMVNFDFDLQFKVESFVLNAVYQGFSHEFPSNSGMLTTQQKGFLQKLSAGDKIYFDDIQCVGPDGSQRKLNTIALKIE